MRIVKWIAIGLTILLACGFIAGAIEDKVREKQIENYQIAQEEREKSAVEVPFEAPVEAVKKVVALTELPSFPKMDNLGLDNFDCDDAAACMLIICDGEGWEYKIIVGNLEMENEKLSECNHVWILVNFQGIDIAYDWGYLQTDYQHYKGFIISRKQLQSALESDIYK